MLKTTRSHLFSSTIIAGVVALATPVFAQTTSPASQTDTQATEIEEVIVTGSRIRRDPTSAATPLIQVTTEEIDRSGQTALIEYLATIPALNNSQVPGDQTTALNLGGLSLPNLRALGSNRTLTLVNGRRHVGAVGGGLAVDADSIPRLLIENIEIITGGASSVYGADAVSGVLNFNLRRDFEGLEIDARYSQINQDGQANARIAVLTGANLLDERLNVYAFGEYEKGDALIAEDYDWLREGYGLVGTDADPVSAVNDGIYDARLFGDRRTLQLVRWGQVTLANQQQPSPLADPDVSLTNTATTGPCTTANNQNTQCFPVNPGYTYVFDGLTARQANFGTRVQDTGGRVINVGGDGENPNTSFNVNGTYPSTEVKRFQTGLNFEISPALTIRAEAKYIDEETELSTGPAFGTIYIANGASNPATDSQPIQGQTTWSTRTDNAFLPANLRTAILANQAVTYCVNTAGCAGGVAFGAPLNGGVAQSLPFARWDGWLINRTQQNFRETQRYVVSADGDLGDISIFKNVNYDIGYTYGQVDNLNFENGVDGERGSYAQDAVIDTAGIVNGQPGQIVCRVQLLTATGGTVTNRNPFVAGTGAGSTAVTGVGVGPNQIGASDPDIAGCQPLNAFGDGNQSQAALDYITATLFIEQQNKQHDALASVSANLWDFWGAGPIGIALGAEYRKEETVGRGRSTALNGRLLQLNTGADQQLASYETKEFFGELAVPLFQDSWLGQGAELSGSYRHSDFSTFGANEVYGVNLVYRPIADITFKSSFNTSVRAPSLVESFGPKTQTFVQFGNTDPCDAQVIQALADKAVAANRIVNCGALAQAAGLNFTFNDPSAPNAYRPVYGSSSPGFNQGNPNLKPEEAESFTFSTVLQPRFIPDLAVVLDYYEIQIDNVIQGVGAQTAAENCIAGATLNTAACETITRSPVDDPATARDDRFLITSFIQGSINYAKRTVRGIDFSATYKLDTEEAWGMNLGRFDYRLAGGWLIEQKQFNNLSAPAEFTELASTNPATTTSLYPRTRLTSSLSWTPTPRFTLAWDMDFQTAVDIIQRRDFVQNADQRDPRYINTGNFFRNDFSVRYDVNEQTVVRVGVTNAFDYEPAEWTGANIFTSQDTFGRRFFVNLNWRPY